MFGDFLRPSWRTKFTHIHAGILHKIGGPHYVGGNIALAAIHDLALLSSMFGMFSGYIHAAALLRSESIAASEVTPMIMALLNAMIELPTNL